MSVSDGYAVPPGPSPARSFYDSLRFRLRLMSYALSFVRRPTPYETAGLIVGLLGAASTLALIFKFVIDLPTIDSLAATFVLLLIALAAFLRRTVRIPAIMLMAARDPWRTGQLHRDMKEGLANDRAFDVLERIYLPRVTEVNELLRTKSGSRELKYVCNDNGECAFLAVVIPARPGEELDHLLIPDWRLRPRGWAMRTAKFADARQQYVRSLHDAQRASRPWADDEAGDNLILSRIETDSLTGGLRLEVSLGTYGQIVRTSDSLINEFAIFAHVARDRADELSRLEKWCARLRFLRIGDPIELSADAALRHLPWRRSVHQRAGSFANLLISPMERAAGLGVAVALVRTDTERLHAYAARRSPTVGTYADVRHVVPAGMCNAKEDLRADGTPLRRDFLKWTILGELLEECYDEEEVSLYRTEDWVGRIRELCLERGLSTESPVFTGLALDLLNLRPEICALVEVVHPDDRAPKDHFKLCWEYRPDTGVASIPLDAAGATCRRTDWVQSGAASLALANEWYSSRSEQGMTWTR